MGLELSCLPPEAGNSLLDCSRFFTNLFAALKAAVAYTQRLATGLRLHLLQLSLFEIF